MFPPGPSSRLLIINQVYAMKKQKGFGLLEALAALTVSSIMFAGLARMSGDAQKQLRETSTAQHFKQVSDAATKYIQDNSAIIQATATATTPAVVTTAMLKTTGYLPASFTGSNPYGQSLQVEILQPTTGNLQATVLSLGGSTIPDAQSPRIAAKVGANGGSTSSANPTTAQGAFGGWSQALTHNTQPGAGHLVGMLYFNNGQLVSDYLRRHSVAGHPEVNQMFTTFDMNGQTINNANQVNAQKVNLPAGNSLQVGSSYYYGDGVNSAIRQSGGLYVQNQSGTTLFNTDSAGNTSNPGWSTVGGAVSTQYMQDSNNPGYYSDPNGTSRTNYTVQDNAYTYGWNQADVYYDAYNNGYYLQPRGTNRVNYVVADNQTTLGNNATNGAEYADVYYDRWNQGYYMQPRGTNRMNYIVADNQYTYGNHDANDYYIRAIGKWASQLGSGGIKGNFQVQYNGACLIPNPYTGGCSCPTGSVVAQAGVFYMNGFWSSAPDYLYQCAS
jgi:type II secretory pathway pseudopilin PulG